MDKLPSSTCKIIHLSDLHLGYKPICCTKDGWRSLLWTQISNKERTDFLFREIVKQYKREAENIFVVITGDVTDDGSDSQMDLYEEKLKILTEAKFRVFSVIGNHDTGPDGSFLLNDVTRMKFKKRFSSWETETKHGVTLLNVDSMSEKTLGDAGGDGLWSDGGIGKKQIKKIASLLKKDVVKDTFRVVCLHHHPFEYAKLTKLSDGKEFLKMIRKEEAEMVLFGHRHIFGTFDYRANDEEKPTWMIASGSSVFKNRAFERIVSWLEIDLDGTKDQPNVKKVTLEYELGVKGGYKVKKKDEVEHPHFLAKGRKKKSSS